MQLGGVPWTATQMRTCESSNVTKPRPLTIPLTLLLHTTMVLRRVSFVNQSIYRATGASPFSDMSQVSLYGLPQPNHP